MNVDLHPERDLNLISLCTGGGGLDRAVELAIPRARPVVCVERESFAIANLVAQMRDGVMAPAPVWPDARTFAGRRWRGLVDGVIGGIPCQPHSLAGKRLGREDERDLWGVARRIFVQSGAFFILIENVGGMLSSGGAERVRSDLLRMGCAVEGGLFTAAEVGANQERERLFILGVADTEGRPQRSGLCPAGHGQAELQPEHRGCDMADAHLAQLSGQSPAGKFGIDEPYIGSCIRSRKTELAHAGHAGPQGRRSSADRSGKRSASERGRHEMGDSLGWDGPRWPGDALESPQRRAAVEWASEGPLFAPGPSDIDAWRYIAERRTERLPAVSRHDLFRIEIRAALLAAHGDPSARPAQAWGGSAPDTWLDPQGPYGLRQAVVQGIAQSTLRRRSDGVASRIDQLRMLGNGVVDLEGAHAFRTLAHRLASRSAGAAELVRLMGLEA